MSWTSPFFPGGVRLASLAWKRYLQDGGLSASHMTSIAAVTLNYGTPADTLATVRALQESRGVELRIYVVENGSGDGSWEFLSEQLAKDANVELIRQSTNVGFARGCNLGIEKAVQLGLEKVLLISSDVLVEPTTIRVMAETLDQFGGWSVQPILMSRRTGNVDSLGQMIAEDGGVIDAGIGEPLPNSLSEPAYEIFGACAAAVMFRTEIFPRIGFLRDDFFIYYEDVDFSFRIRESGGKALLAAGARAHHSRFGTSGTWSLKYYYEQRNLVAVRLRHYAARDLISRRAVRDLRFALYQAVKHDREREFLTFLAGCAVAPRLMAPRGRRALLNEWRGVERRTAKRVQTPSE